MQHNFDELSLAYHSNIPTGKIGMLITKPCTRAHDLSMAYTPGVGAPCLAIHADKNLVYKYTNKGNTIAIVSDGTAVLGLGEVGPEAGLPVMEGKAVLFKKFADIDAYPICLGGNIEHCNKRKKDLITSIHMLEPSFGGINLEDIKAPFCFDLQEKLDASMRIPVFHDDQDGTGIVIVAGIINSLGLVNKKIENLRIVINGAGAAGIACAKLLLEFGVIHSQIYMCDSTGLIVKNRSDINKNKKLFAQNCDVQKLEEVICGADIFIGVSRRGLLTKNMVALMNKDPIIFAVANPIPEIMPEEALAAGAKIIGTGRSDYPNQVNNSLGFPGIFRAALDTRSLSINRTMMMAASHAIASIIGEPATGKIKDILKKAYPDDAKNGFFDSNMCAATNYVIPKQFDLRVVPRVAAAVARAAMETGVARIQIPDLKSYEQSVLNRVMRNWK